VKPLYAIPLVPVCHIHVPLSVDVSVDRFVSLSVRLAVGFEEEVTFNFFYALHTYIPRELSDLIHRISTFTFFGNNGGFETMYKLVIEQEIL